MDNFYTRNASKFLKSSAKQAHFRCKTCGWYLTEDEVAGDGHIYEDYCPVSNQWIKRSCGKVVDLLGKEGE